MPMRLKPEALRQAMKNTGCVSKAEFGWKFLNKSGTTTLKYFRGETTPSLETAFIVAKLAREPLDQIVVEDNSITA